MIRKDSYPYGKKNSIVTKFVRFRNITEKDLPKKVKGVHLVKKRVQIAISPTWAFQILPPEGCCFRRKQPFSPGRAGWHAPPLFCYKKGEEGREKGFSLLGTSDSLEIAE